MEAALRECEKALSLWRYSKLRVASGDEETKGEVEIVEDRGNNAREHSMIVELKVDLLLRIASYNIELKDFPTGLSACREVLKLDRQNVKAYYLSARSRILNTNSGIDELQLAIDDLREALVINPNN